MDIDPAAIEAGEHLTEADTATEGPQILSDTQAVSVISQIFGMISAVRKKDFWRLSDKEKGILTETIGSVRRLFSIDKYLKNFSIISFGFTLLHAGISRLLRDIKGSGDSDETEDETEEEPQRKHTPATVNTKAKRF